MIAWKAKLSRAFIALMDRIENASIKVKKAYKVYVPKPIRFLLHPILIIISLCLLIPAYMIIAPIVSLIEAWQSFD